MAYTGTGHILFVSLGVDDIQDLVALNVLAYFLCSSRQSSYL